MIASDLTALLPYSKILCCPEGKIVQLTAYHASLYELDGYKGGAGDPRGILEHGRSHEERLPAFHDEGDPRAAGSIKKDDSSAPHKGLPDLR